MDEINYDVQKEDNTEELKTSFHQKFFFLLYSFIFITIICLIGYYYFFFPKIILNGEQNMTIVYPNVYQEPGAYLTRFGKQIEGNPTINGTFDSAQLGNYKVKYSYR